MTTRQKHKAKTKTQEARAARRAAAKPCPGSRSGLAHGAIYYRHRGVSICQYCDRPVNERRPETPIREEKK